ncbi:MAG TPA: hypothetical protein VME69_00535 [Methylocella sp.]|nr:hypothetical protein [Methylocella sp.]
MQTQDDLKILIDRIVADQNLHARWINTFSYLEYVGFRKIVKSQRAETLTAEILGHACEEGRHALLLKKLAVKIGGAAFDSYAPECLLCGEEAEAYFQNLDHHCDEALAERPEEERTRLVYGYVTWLVERRALLVYAIYKQAIGESEMVKKLGGLLVEEDRHLAQVEGLIRAADPNFADRSQSFEAAERRLYETFLAALSEALTPASKIRLAG